MEEILSAFVVSLILELYYLSQFDKVLIVTSVITLLIVYYTTGFDKALVDIDVFLLWVILFYTLVTYIISRSRRRKFSNRNRNKKTLSDESTCENCLDKDIWRGGEFK